MKRIGILGGTFDPPHIGHLIIAEEVRLALDLEEIWFIPTAAPPHKDGTRTPAEERVMMTELAILDNPFFKLNTIEIERTGRSYTVDTIRELKERYPKCDFHFIIGADMVEYLPKWHEIDHLLQLVTFVGVKRTGYELVTPYDILIVDIPSIEISSSFIRERLIKQCPARYFMPDEVYEYIRREKLYGIK